MNSKYSAVNRQTPTFCDGILALAVIGFALCISFWFRPNTQGPLTATVRLDGDVLMELALENLDKPIQYEPDELNYPLVLEFAPTHVQVLYSQCPGLDCVHQGSITSAGQQLICLPNRLSIALSGGDSSGPDLILG